tara:strand:- start:4990 stop:6453 length:1464 start_codon:yes stop_codon:yes gene_type:complete
LVKTHGNYINGKEVKSDSRKTFVSLNPTTEQTIAKFQQGTAKDVNKAITVAQKAQKKWSSIPAPHRGEILLEVARILKKNKEKLGKLESVEMGKILPEGLGDVQEAIDVFEYMAGEGRRLFGYTTPSELQKKVCYTKREPLGVVGLITPWNFPIAIPSWKIAPALICGNGIVFKPSSDTAKCAYELVKICEEAGVPKGVINLVTGSGEEVGSAMIKNPRIAGISFTGSRAIGEFVTVNAGLKKVGLELGGKNPIIIMDDANLDLALEGVIFGAFGTTGQRCTAASRILIHKNIFNEFQEKLVKTVKKLKVGNPLKSSTHIGPLVAKRAVEKVHSYTNIGKKERAKLLCGGNPIKRKGFFYEPTIFTNVKPNMRIAQEEIFGPTTSLMKFKNLKEALEVANSVDYGLSASVFTNNLTDAYTSIEKLETGIVYVNAPTIGAEVHLPFGGVKNTGNGTREAGIEGIHEFSETKTVYIDYSGRLQKAQGIE